MPKQVDIWPNGYRIGLKFDLNPEVPSSNPAGGSEGMPLGKAFYTIFPRPIGDGR